MKKNKSTKAKVRNLVRILVILFLSMIITTICCKKESAANDKILEATVNDAFVFQSLMLVNSLEPNKPNSFTDIEALEDDSDSFVSDAAIKTGKSQYYIRVNYGANCVNIYTKDDEGNYTKPYKAMICSTGKSTPTAGTYKITYKYRWLRLFGDVYGQYSTRIVKNILFHSVPYFEQRADTLEYEEYDKLGTTASAGCIRLTVQDAKWIYDNITSGTYVEFYSDRANPGPLGKPKAQKISDNKDCRDWDPTDPDKNNPWNGGSGIPSITYTSPKKTTNTTTKTNTTNTSKNNKKEELTTTNTNTNTSTSKNTNTITNSSTNSSIYKNETTNKDSETTNSTIDKKPSNTVSTNTSIETNKSDNISNSTIDTTAKPTPESKPEKKPETETKPESETTNSITKPETSEPATKPVENTSSQQTTSKPKEETTTTQSDTKTNNL